MTASEASGVARVLIVDDEKHTREGLQQALADSYDVTIAASADEAFNLLDAQPFDVVVTDLRMPGKSGLKVIDKALALPQRPAVLMMTAYGNIDTAVEAMKRGAVDFLSKPVYIERLEVLIQRALEIARMVRMTPGTEGEDVAGRRSRAPRHGRFLRTRN